MEGVDGLAKIKEIMQSLRNDKPEKIGEFNVLAIRDYKTGIRYDLVKGEETKLDLTTSNVMYFELSDGASFVARPSGTEPKIKLYYLAQGTTESDAKEILIKIKNAVEKSLGV